MNVSLGVFITSKRNVFYFISKLHIYNIFGTCIYDGLLIYAFFIATHQFTGDGITCITITWL